MSKKLQILYMQTRLVRLASELWEMDMSAVNALFHDNDIYRYIETMWDLFHVEGDMAVLEDIQEHLKSKGVTLWSQN